MPRSKLLKKPHIMTEERFAQEIARLKSTLAQFERKLAELKADNEGSEFKCAVGARLEWRKVPVLEA
jgi:hypothetical protein